MDRNKKTSLYLSEIVERLARLDLYVKSTAANQTSPAFAGTARTFADCIVRVIKTTISAVSEGDSAAADKLHDILRYLPNLELSANAVLPNANVPSELKRFLRFLERNILAQDDHRVELKCAVSRLGAGTFKTAKILESLKLDLIFPCEEGTSSEEINDFGSASHTVAIEFSAMGCVNPLQWPVALHEVGHHIFARLEEDEKHSVLTHFANFLGLERPDELVTYFKLGKDVDVGAWVKEVWCDCFAAYVIGPIFFYSQFQAFLHAEYWDATPSHPGPSVRLYILETFLSHRYRDNFTTSSSYPYLQAIESLEGQSPYFLGESPNVRRFVNKISQWLLKYFPGKSSSATSPVREYNQKILGVVETASNLDFNILDSLATRLSKGLPIPSIEGILSDERATTLGEILYAGWISIKGQIGELIQRLEDYDANGLIQKASAIIKVCDERVLSSLQVSEWVEAFLTKLTERDPVLPAFDSTPTAGVLGFSQIAHEIKSRSLAVIPLIDALNQIGRCSLDLRLGTSFELLSDSRGSINFLDDDSKLDSFTTHHELDFADSITISPGQFVIAHTMEYIQMPRHLCGHIEGRSSFARVGLMVHVTAGFLEPGYRGSVTLEIYNLGTAPVVLFPGYRLCQLRLMQVSQIPEGMFAPKRYEQQYGFNRTRKSLDVEIDVINSLRGRRNHQ